MTEQQPELRIDEQPEAAEPEEAGQTRTSRDVLFEQIGVTLVNAGVISPAAEFVADVRKVTGTRMSPREVAVAVEQMAAANKPISPEAVGEMVTALRGDRSPRQQRHADEWRMLGAKLTLHEQDGSPEGQRAFIGAAHASAGPHATDALLLRVALTLFDLGRTPDADLVGKVGKRLATSAADIDPEQLPPLIERELRAVFRDAKRTRREGRPASSPGQNQGTRQYNNPGARKFRPGKRRGRSVQLPKDKPPEPFER